MRLHFGLGGRRVLGDGLRLAIERGLVHPKLALQQHAVGGNFVTGLQKHHVAHHDLLGGDFRQGILAEDLGMFVLARGATQRGRLALLPPFEDRRHAIGEENCHQHPDGLVPLRTPAEKQPQLDGQRHQQDFDQRVAEAAQQPMPQRLRRQFRQDVRAVRTAACRDL